MNIKIYFMNELYILSSFSLCFGFDIFGISDSTQSNVSCSHRSSPTVNTLASEKSHDFCLLANINDGRVLIGTEFEVRFCSCEDSYCYIPVPALFSFFMYFRMEV